MLLFVLLILLPLFILLYTNLRRCVTAGRYIEFAIDLSFAFLCYVFIGAYVTQNYRIASASMAPTIKTGDLVLADKVGVRFGSVRRGDIVTFDPPLEKRDRFVKRVLGLPGETVYINDDSVRITLDTCPADTLRFHIANNSDFRRYQRRRLRSNEYFMVGDNYENSYDSRNWGPVKRESIHGKIVFRYWPLSAFGPVNLSPRYKDQAFSC